MRTLLAAAVMLTALTGCTTAPTECERVWAEATAILPAPAGVELRCVEGFADSRLGEADDTGATIALLPPAIARVLGSTPTQTAVHELAHLWARTATPEKRAAHFAALGTTEAEYEAGEYTEQPAERFAASVAMHLAQTEPGQTDTYDIETTMRALGALE